MEQAAKEAQDDLLRAAEIAAGLVQIVEEPSALRTGAPKVASPLPAALARHLRLRAAGGDDDRDDIGGMDYEPEPTQAPAPAAMSAVAVGSAVVTEANALVAAVADKAQEVRSAAQRVMSNAAAGAGLA